ncbi:hypothetical protein BT69DRAFT_1324780 [Atractiella rhizophila]|nr:hypothetical protein BT69DRAFT_1324780 [Atractiella rhizophila]
MPRPSAKPRYSLNTPPTTPTKRGSSAPPESPTGTTSKTPSKLGPSQSIGTVAETPYHKKLKNLLADHRKIRKGWIALVLGVEGLGNARKIVEIADETSSALASLDSLTTSSASMRENLRTDYILQKSQELSSLLSALQNTMAQLRSMIEQMEQTVDALERLLMDASKARGIEWTFSKPAWLTWPLSRFVDTVSTLQTGYGEQTALLSLLFEAILPPQTLMDLSWDGVQEEERREKGMQRQAALSYWATVPLVRVEQEKEFEEICSVEWIS